MKVGANKAATDEEEVTDLRRGGRGGGGRSSSIGQRYSYRGDRMVTRRSYYRRPSALERVGRAIEHNVLRPIGEYVIEPLDRATRDARRELEDVILGSIAVHVSTALGAEKRFWDKLVSFYPNAETCKVDDFVTCSSKAGVDPDDPYMFMP